MSKYLNLHERIYAGTGKYSIPQIEPVQDIDISEWIGFNYVKSYKKQADKIGVNFSLTITNLKEFGTSQADTQSS